MKLFYYFFEGNVITTEISKKIIRYFTNYNNL